MRGGISIWAYVIITSSGVYGRHLDALLAGNLAPPEQAALYSLPVSEVLPHSGSSNFYQGPTTWDIMSSMNPPFRSGSAGDIMQASHGVPTFRLGSALNVLYYEAESLPAQHTPPPPPQAGWSGGDKGSNPWAVTTFAPAPPPQGALASPLLPPQGACAPGVTTASSAYLQQGSSVCLRSGLSCSSAWSGVHQRRTDVPLTCGNDGVDGVVRPHQLQTKYGAEFSTTMGMDAFTDLSMCSPACTFLRCQVSVDGFGSSIIDPTRCW